MPAAYLENMEARPRVPSLRITVNVDLTNEEIETTMKVLRKSAEKFISK